MRIDFHTHGKLAKKLPFSTEYTDWLFGSAARAGLDAVCLTEHFNTCGFDEVYNYISSQYERDGDTFLCNGLRIFPGMETDIIEGGHILSIGPMEAVLELNHRLESHKESPKFLPLDELLELFSQYPVIVGAGHPFRFGGHIPELSITHLKKFDFIDLNGKDMADDKVLTRKQIEEFSRHLQIPYVAGSDTHQACQYGCICNHFEKTCRTVPELLDEIKAGNYKIEMKEDIAFQVETAAMLKKALKQIYSLGGDYVSILTGTEAKA